MNYNLLKIKDNDIDARSAGNVVYKRYMNCRHRVADMPLDFIFLHHERQVFQRPFCHTNIDINHHKD